MSVYVRLPFCSVIHELAVEDEFGQDRERTYCGLVRWRAQWWAKDHLPENMPLCANCKRCSK